MVKHATCKQNFWSPLLKGDYKLFSLKVGLNTLRILPPTWENPKHYGIDVFYHSITNKKGESNLFVCKNKMNGKDCETCNKYHRASARNRRGDMYKFSPKRSVAVYVLDRNNKKEGPLLWMMSWSTDMQLSRMSIDFTDNSVLVLDDPDCGYDITIKRRGLGLKTTYGRPEIKRYSTKVPKKWLTYIANKPLPNLINI